MKRKTFVFTLMILASLYIGCTTERKEQKNIPATIAVVEEQYFTVRDTLDNVDSPAVWHGPDNQHWLLATAKETDALLVFDAITGDLVKRIGQSGTMPGQLDRPNGVAVVDNLVLVVERDNARVQVFSLPHFESLGTLGEDQLVKPYGLTLYPETSSSYRLYVTDNYETEDEQVPADSLLDQRVHLYSLTVQDDSLYSEHLKAFGETEGAGVLRVVESILVDQANQRLLIAEELEGASELKGYDLDGTFNNEIVGKTYFPHQAEGIALFECVDNGGYWIATDQADETSTFHLFDRLSLEHLGSFRGNETKNTDGIALTQEGFGSFENGAFFAVHDDGNVAAFDWQTVTESLGISGYCG